MCTGARCMYRQPDCHYLNTVADPRANEVSLYTLSSSVISHHFSVKRKIHTWNRGLSYTPPPSLSLWLTLPYIRFHGDFLTVPTPCKLLLPIPTPPPLSPNSLPSSSCRFQLLLIDGVVVLWGIGSVPVINTCYADLFLRGAAYWFVGKLLQRWVGVGVCGRVTTQVASESSHGQPLDSPSQSQTTRSPRVHNNFSFNCGWLFACFSHLYWISKLQNVFWCMSRYTHWTPSVNYHTI